MPAKLHHRNCDYGGNITLNEGESNCFVAGAHIAYIATGQGEKQETKEASLVSFSSSSSCTVPSLRS